LFTLFWLPCILFLRDRLTFFFILEVSEIYTFVVVVVVKVEADRRLIFSSLGWVVHYKSSPNLDLNFVNLGVRDKVCFSAEGSVDENFFQSTHSSDVNVFVCVCSRRFSVEFKQHLEAVEILFGDKFSDGFDSAELAHFFRRSCLKSANADNIWQFVLIIY
jgi:hypothetical protein